VAKLDEPKKILVVDDAPGTVEVLRRNLTAKGYSVLTASNVPEAVATLEKLPVDLVITDFKMPSATGLELVRHIRSTLRDTEVIMITGYATVGGAVQAVKTGAEEYLAKPFTDEELFSAVERSLAKLERRRLMRTPTDQADMAAYGLIGKSDAMLAVYDAIGKAARTTATVLISGESGTGKELIARAIHYSGPRSAEPFVPVNCVAIPETLLESELFGHAKGAFTGATESRGGFFQAASGGTIFLDEVGDMSPAMQARLLRVLQEKEVVMVGSSEPQRVDVRVLAATNKDLHRQVEKGEFREDLYFRLEVIPIRVPPLRERGNDIFILARQFCKRAAEEVGRIPPRFSEAVLDVFKTYHWPGNVRELQNIVHRLVVMTEGDVVDAPDLPALMHFSALGGSKRFRTLAAAEAEYIRNVLASVGGNKTRAAEILGIDRKTLRDKLR